MNTYAFELRTLKPWSWFIGISGVVVVVMTMYPMVAKDASDFMRVIDGMPEAFKSMFNLDMALFSSVLGFFGYALNYIKIIAGIQAMLWGATVITKERRFHTAEFLLAKPCSRERILTAKLAAVLTGLAATTIVFIIMSVIMLAVYGDGYSGVKFFLIILGFLGLQLVFFSVGLLVGTSFQKIKNPLGICLGTVFGTYIAGSLGGLGGDNMLKLLSPFEYFSANDLLTKGHYGAGGVVLALVITVLCIAGSFFVFSRQDIM